MKLDAIEATFEIRVAFIGPKNSGKSTLINALLRDKYTPVGIGGSTVSVNSFRIFTNLNPLPTAEADARNDDAASSIFDTISSVGDDEESMWTVVPENLRTAAETIQMIPDHRRSQPVTYEVPELTFDVELPEGLCDMHHDAQIVLVDIPGIEIHDSYCKFLNYLDNKWDTFDCVVFVMDVLQPLEEQVSLLKFVQRKLAAQSFNTSIIVVCNKVEDPNNPEVASILSVAQALSQEDSMMPFIPLSADLAYVYRATGISGLTFERFQRLDFELIDKIGYSEFSRSNWMRMSPGEKYELVFGIASDNWRFDQLLASTSFPSFHQTLSHYVGGEETQQVLIEKQLNVALRQEKILSCSSVASMTKILSVCERIQVVAPLYKIKFWALLSSYTEGSIKEYKTDMDFKTFYLAMSQLIEFDALLTENGSNAFDHQRVTNEMVSLVRLQINELLKHANACLIGNEYSCSDEGVSDSLYYDFTNKNWAFINGLYGQFHSGGSEESPPKSSALHWTYVGMESWINMYTKEVKESVHNPISGRSVWYDLSLMDFKTAIASILLLTYSKAFNMYFGPERVRLESFLRRHEAMHLTCSVHSSNWQVMFNALAGKYDDDGNFIPKNKDLYDIFSYCFEMPSQLSDPKHWGHLAWMFCKFMDSKSS